MKKNKIALIILTIVLALSVGWNVYGFIGGKETQLKISNLEENIDKVNKELAAAKSQVDKKEKEYSDLKTKNEKLLSDKDKLQKDYDKLKKENEDLKVKQEKVSLEEKESLIEKLRAYIFNNPDNLPSAAGINWTENFYDNLTVEEIWNVIEEFKEKNNGKEGTLNEQASYLSQNAPIKDNWKELFLENWNNDEKITKLVDQGDTVGVYTESLPYTGAEENYPYVTLFKRTGYWHG